jgi:hypothetical protein
MVWLTVLQRQGHRQYGIQTLVTGLPVIACRRMADHRILQRRRGECCKVIQVSITFMSESWAHRGSEEAIGAAGIVFRVVCV